MLGPAIETFFAHISKCAALFLSAAILASGPVDATAETDPMDAPYENVRYSGDETLRDFVARYLRDPDLWPAVLKLNELASPADLTPGTMIRMPVRQVNLADDALSASLIAIQKATAEGARLFAPKEIGSAIENRDVAIDRRGEGEWRDVVSFAGLAADHANDAFQISVVQRDRAAEAVITDIHGNVEGRNPAEDAWSDRQLQDILVEFERLRTLSRSTTQVTFRDLSRLRLNPNSNATIQRMRSDPLTGKEVTKVSLANGDFYALLNQLSERDSFEIDVPGIKTTTESSDFWIKNERDRARFVNFDEASLDIRAGTSRVSLGLDEGVVITSDGKAVKTEALDRAALASPEDGGEVYGTAVDLSWKSFPDAAGYWLEVAADPGYNKMIATEWGVKGTQYRAEGLTPGVHFWRVAALDPLGLPGKWSDTRKFDLRIDTTPPFLTLFAPADGAIVENAAVTILGASEKNVVIELNGQDVPVASDGGFLADLTLQPGKNTFVLVAIDAAGNRSEKSQVIEYRPRENVQILLDAGMPRSGDTIVSRNADITILATTNARAGLEVVLRDMVGAEVGRTRIEVDGGLSLSVPVEPELKTYQLEVISDGGAVLGSAGFEVLRDETAPEITLVELPPRSSFDEMLNIAGSVSEAATLTLAGRPVALDENGAFSAELTLSPGSNLFELRAEDTAGNVGLFTVETMLDLDPPEILDVRIERPDGEAGPIEIEVEARDPSGLRQAAQFIVEIGSEEHEGYLRCDSAAGLCRATLPAGAGEMSVIEVVVLDYAGNEAIW